LAEIVSVSAIFSAQNSQRSGIQIYFDTSLNLGTTSLTSELLFKKKAGCQREVTYTGTDLFFNGLDNFVDASPLILVFGAALDHAEALQNVDDVIDAASLYSQFLGALV